MKKRRKLLAAILICSGVLAASLISPVLALGIIVFCAIPLWIEYDICQEKWLKMRAKIIKEQGGWYL